MFLYLIAIKIYSSKYFSPAQFDLGIADGEALPKN
jgi:hypothetical protein